LKSVNIWPGWPDTTPDGSLDVTKQRSVK